MVKCSKCGTECNDKALFCSNCGKSLDDEREEVLSKTRVYKCSKCGATFKGKKAFCENCGTKLTFDGETVPETPKTVEKVEGPAKMTKATKIVNIVLYSLSFVVILLSLIAVWVNSASFPAIASLLGNVFPDSIGVEWFFGSMWEDEANIVSFIFAFIAFLTAVVLTYTFGIIALVKQIKSGAKKEFKIYSKPLCFAAIMPLMSHMISYVVLYVNESEYGFTLKEELGGGLKLSLAAVSILFIILVVYHVFNNIKSKKDIVPSVFKYVIAVLILIAARYAFVGTRELDSGFSSVTAETNPSFLMHNRWSGLVTQDTTLSHFFVDVMLQNTCLVMLFVSLMSVFNSINKENAGGSRLVNPIITVSFMVFYVLMYFITKDSIESVGGPLTLGTNFIVSLVLMFVALGLAIATSVIEKKKKANA